MAYTYDDSMAPPRVSNVSTKFQDPLEIKASEIDHHSPNRQDSARTMRPDDGEGDQRAHRLSPQVSNEGAIPSPSRSEQASISSVSPELIAEITEKIKKEVVEHLKQTGTLENATAPPEQAKQEQPRSEPVRAEPIQAEPVRTEAPRGGNISAKSSSTSSPPPNAQSIHTPPSPQQAPKRAPSPPLSPTKRSPPNTPTEKSGVRFSNRGMPDLSNRSTRPPPPGQTYSTMELNSIDQKWGMLFDKERNPTPRLGQFLRGLANHLIDEFPPKKSIVITPEKMAAFYTNFPLDKEIHPLLSIFRTQSYEHISQLYQDLACPHHLVQEDSMKAPCVPGLTPVGFAQWMTIHLLAYPDQEYSRLEKVVLGTPIDADGEMVDGKPERLPKQISRYLLPTKEDKKSRELLEDAIADYLDDMEFSRRRKGSLNSPPLSRQTSTTQTKTRPIDIPRPKSPTKLERERKPYSGTPGTDTPVVEIERERKPYTAQPGGGKVYSDSLNPPPTNRPGRANSASRVAPQDQGSHDRHIRTQSNASSSSYVPPPRAGGGRRPPSPPIQKFSQSTPLNLDNSNNFPPAFSSSSSNFSPSSFASNPGMPPPPPLDLRDRDRERDRDRDRDRDDDGRRYSARERRGTQDEMRGDTSVPRDPDRWDRENRGDFRSDGRSYEEYYRGTGRGYENGQYQQRY